MKTFKKTIIILSLLILPLVFLAGCEDLSQQSIKSITNPQIATYECVEARYGRDNLLEKYEFIKITLLDDKELELSFKSNGEKKSKTFPYTFDCETRELSCEGTVLGCKVMEKVKIEDGEFTVKKTLGNKTLIMKFKAS